MEHCEIHNINNCNKYIWLYVYSHLAIITSYHPTTGFLQVENFSGQHFIYNHKLEQYFQQSMMVQHIWKPYIM